MFQESYFRKLKNYRFDTTFLFISDFTRKHLGRKWCEGKRPWREDGVDGKYPTPGCFMDVYQNAGVAGVFVGKCVKRRGLFCGWGADE